MTSSAPQFEKLKLTTPNCKFQYAWLVTPDTKYEQPVWKVTALIPAADATEMEEQLEGLLSRFQKQCKEAEPSKKNWKSAPKSFGYDDIEGEAVFYIKMKRKVSGQRKDKTVWTNTPPALFDAMGKPLSEGMKEKVDKIGPGSVGRISFQASPYNHPSTGVGIKVEPLAAQIIDLKEYTKSSTSYGFEATEGNFQATSEATSFENSGEADDTGDF
jgi:hypothetical protein